jgi:transposase-like protein
LDKIVKQFSPFNLGIMKKQRRIFTPEDRHSIVQESIRDGQSEVSRKYNLSPSLLRRWKQKYLDKGKEGLRNSYPRVDPQLRALEEENERLKRIVPKQDLELEWDRPAVKSELLKKLLSASGKDRNLSHYQQDTSRKELCKWLELPRSVSYYKPRHSKPGAKASQVTMKLDGTFVPNEDVVLRIKQLIDTEFNADSDTSMQRTS